MRGQIIMTIPNNNKGDSITVPNPPTDGDYILQCVNGDLSWVKTSDMVGFGSWIDIDDDGKITLMP